MNDSDSWGVTNSEVNGSAFNFTWFDAYNNSGLDWLGGYTYDAAYNWSWNNNTNVGNNTELEVVWLYSNYNLSTLHYSFSVWNTSAITYYNGSDWK